MVSVFISSIRLPFRISETTLRHLKMNLHFCFLGVHLVAVGRSSQATAKPRMHIYTEGEICGCGRLFCAVLSATTKSDKEIYISRHTWYAEWNHAKVQYYVYGNQMMTILTSLYIIINPLYRMRARASRCSDKNEQNKAPNKLFFLKKKCYGKRYLIERWLHFIDAGVTS